MVKISKTSIKHRDASIQNFYSSEMQRKIITKFYILLLNVNKCLII